MIYVTIFNMYITYIYVYNGVVNSRIGITKQSTWTILRHPFFLGFDLNNLHNGTITPEYIPRKPELFESYANLSQMRDFRGDQDIFKDF